MGNKIIKNTIRKWTSPYLEMYYSSTPEKHGEDWSSFPSPQLSIEAKKAILSGQKPTWQYTEGEPFYYPGTEIYTTAHPTKNEDPSTKNIQVNRVVKYKEVPTAQYPDFHIQGDTLYMSPQLSPEQAERLFIQRTSKSTWDKEQQRDRQIQDAKNTKPITTPISGVSIPSISQPAIPYKNGGKLNYLDLFK